MFIVDVDLLFTVKAQSAKYYFKSMQEAKQLHAHIITTGFHQQELSLRRLITFLAITNPSSLNYARLIFDQIENPSTFIYNTMIRAYSTSSEPQQALHLYNQMHKNGLPPDKYTFPFLLKSCSSLFHHLHKGQATHCQSIKHGLDSNIFVQNSLIHLYGSNAKIDAAHQVFDEMSERDIPTWTTLVSCYANLGSITMARKLFDRMPHRSTVSFSAMISGYVRKGRFNQALELFRDLQIEGLEPNDSMIMGVICACANLRTLDNGRWIHSYIRDRKENKYDSRITTALIDMYFKCGSIQDAINVFVGAKKKHVGEWTAMISGMSMHGLGERSIRLFEDMVRSGVKPNVVTFVALLSGCSHGGLVNEGLMYFERMKSEFGIEPTVEHYGCVVDFLGRAGLIDQAMEFLKEMPVEANATMWGSLLNACRVYKNVEVGELTARWLVKEEPWNGGVYMTLMSLYKEAGRWEDVKNVKNEMKKVGCRKNPGCSLIEVNGVFNEFVVGDKSHPLAFEMCIRIGEMVMEVKENKWDFL